MPTTTQTRILTGALDLLRGGGSVSLESAAERAGLTKPGLMYHFRTKETLMLGLVDFVVSRWEARLADLVGVPANEASPTDRIRAYVSFALVTEFDESDLVFLSDPRLRDALSVRWVERMEPWIALPDDLSQTERARLLAVRLMADGAWFASAAKVLAPSPAEREQILAVALELTGGME